MVRLARLCAATIPIALLIASAVFVATFVLSTHAQEPSRDGQLKLDQLPASLDATTTIDLAIDAELQRRQLRSTPIVDDAVFGRRIYLDLLGRIPRTDELQQFVHETDSRKRELLVDRLLVSDEHAEHMAELLDSILIGRTDVGAYQRRSEVGWVDYLKNAVKQNRPWNDLAREILSARPANEENSQATRGANWYLYSRKNKHQEIAEAVSKDFFGVRIDCAQCHDHPLSSEIEQRHYWGLVAFFNRSTNADTPRGPQLAESAIGGFSEFADTHGRTQVNELVFLDERRVEEKRPEKDVKEEDREDLYVSAIDGLPCVPKFSRREQFVAQVLHNNPRVATAMINRLWALMMGRGLVHPVDAIDSYHPASHPELLSWLSRHFVETNYDVRRFVRSLVLTHTYQRSSQSEDDRDPQWFSAAIAKPLTGEMLHRSLLAALEPVDPGRWNSLPLRIEFTQKFPEVLADEPSTTTAQGLWISNGPEFNELVTAAQSRLLQRSIATTDDADSLDILSQSILGRRLEADEQERFVSHISSHREQRAHALEAIAWAMIASAEFRFNH